VRYARSSGSATNERHADPAGISSPGKDLDLAFGIPRTADSENHRMAIRAATLVIIITWQFQ